MANQFSFPPAETNYTTLFDLFRSGQVSRYVKGVDLAPVTHKPRTLHFIGHGYIKVGATDSSGDEVVYLVLGPGDIFPLLPIVGFETQGGITYTTLSNVKLYSLPQDMVLDTACNKLPLSNAMFEKSLLQFASAANTIVNLGYKRAHERLIYRLLTLCAKFGCRHDSKIRISKIFTHKLIASSIHTTRETVTRELEKLRNKDLIETIDHELLVKDVQRLQEELERPVSPYLIKKIEKKKQCRLHESSTSRAETT